MTYQLLDFGDGRKLESLSGHVIDRPSPAAESARPNDAKAWLNAMSRFDESDRSWQHRDRWPDSLTIDCGEFTMPVAPTPFGHIGVFPEQRSNWDWLQSLPAKQDDYKALNLFGYTGASTIALARAGYQVAHVDAAKPNVAAAKIAAQMNGLSEHPIRYLVDDAAKFAARELRRGNRYDTIVLDPPAYGHSPKGTAWRISRDVWPLLDDCLAIASKRGFRMLVTGHSPEVTEHDIADYVYQQLRTREITGRIESGRSQLKAASGVPLDAGFYVRISTGINTEPNA